VLVPAGLAGDLLRAVVLGLREQVRRDGGAIAPEMERLLYGLHEANCRYDEAEAEALHEATEGHQAPEVEPASTCACGSGRACCVIVAEASGLLDCSPSWVRFLARRGVLQATRAGRDWLIDRASLEDYRHGKGRAA
jgi:excisionase family DNA binding protein